MLDEAGVLDLRTGFAGGVLGAWLGGVARVFDFGLRNSGGGGELGVGVRGFADRRAFASSITFWIRVSSSCSAVSSPTSGYGSTSAISSESLVSFETG